MELALLSLARDDPRGAASRNFSGKGFFLRWRKYVRLTK
jgi:hypothetical protein